jgi:aminoglycoside/choline kinase family phosphotransferase
MIIRGQAQAAAAMRQPGRTHFSPTSSSSATTRAPLRPRQSSHQPPRHTHTQQAATAASHQQQHSTAQQQQQQQQHDRRFDDLAAWLEARGGSVGSITAGDCQMGPVLVRGLLATQVCLAGPPKHQHTTALQLSKFVG